VIEHVLLFGPAALVFGVLLVAVAILNRRRSASWLRFQQWLGSIQQTQRILLQVVYFLALGVLLTFGSFLASRITGKPSVATDYMLWLIWGVSMAIWMPLITGIFQKPQEHEDWLLWDREETKNH
jgi:hypothetical protein